MEARVINFKAAYVRFAPKAAERRRTKALAEQYRTPVSSDDDETEHAPESAAEEAPGYFEDEPSYAKPPRTLERVRHADDMLDMERIVVGMCSVFAAAVIGVFVFAFWPQISGIVHSMQR